MEVCNLKTIIFAFGLLLPHLLLAQPNDCRKSIVICDDRPIMFTPQFGSGSNDFLSSKNSRGCLQRGENISVWFYFELRKDMPLDSGKLAFTISDSVQIRGQDYDFAIYGPRVNCDSLGAPVRCSFAQINPNQRVIRTGLGNGARDVSEGLDGDGFLDTLRVKPGDGYFLLVDFFVGIGSSFDSAVALSFNLTWGGPAAPYLNCIANPNCDIARIDARPDTTICAGIPFGIEAKAINTTGKGTIRWTSTDNSAGFITAPDSFKTNLVFPAGLAGSFSFTATSTEGNCVLQDQINVNILSAPLPVLSGDSLICEGSFATLQASPGFTNYRWSSGQRDLTSISVQNPGRYSITVTGQNGCPGSTSFEVKAKIQTPIKIFGDTVLCPGEQSFLAANPGFSRYQWSTGSQDEVVVITQPGQYFLTVTDKDGCSSVRPLEVRGVVPKVPVISGEDYLCSGTFTTLKAGEGFASYRWSDGSSGDTILTDKGGNYRVTVTDRDGCQTESSFQLSERQSPVASIQGATAFCKGGSTFIKGPPGAYNYFWSGGGRDSILQVNQAGAYTLIIEDTSGCRGSASIFVDTLPLPKIKFTGPTTLCEGQFGRISPGDFAFYQWSTGDVLPDIQVLRSGVYTVTVTDINGCNAVDSIQVNILKNPVPNLVAPMLICPGSEIEIRTQNGFTQYQWNTGDTTSSIRRNVAGNYQVTVTDANGCTGSASTEIMLAPTPMVEIQGLAQVCEGDTARLSANPIFAGYEWSTGAKTPLIEITSPGNYTVTITDRNNCTAQDTFSVQFLKNPPIAIAGPLKFCEGNFTTLKVPGGYPRYTWSTGARDSLIQVRNPGVYKVTVTNAEGCTRSSSVFVSSDIPVPPSLTPGRYPVCQNTAKRLEAGPGFISYTWSDGSSRPYLDVSEAGDYSLTVLDSNLCITSVSFQVAILPIFPPVILGLDSFCQGMRVPLIVADSRYSGLVWSTGEQQNTIYITREGTYGVRATDINGCVSFSSKTVGVRPAPAVEIVGDLEICRGEQTTLSVTGKFVSFEWSNSSKDTILIVSQPGPYGVSARGANGCTGFDEVIVRQSRIPFPIIEGDRYFCSNDSVALEVEAGFKSYSWTTGQSGNKIFVNQEGIYGVTVTDDLGCDGKAQVRVLTIPAPESRISGGLIFCPGDSVLLNADPGLAAYRWSSGITGATNIWVKTPGWQVLEVQAQNGCTDRDSVLVQFAPVPQPKISGNTFFCADSTAILSIVDTFARFQWGGGETVPQRSIRQAGQYTVSVTNNFGCSAEDTINLELIQAPVPIPDPDTFFTCSRRELTLGIASFFAPPKLKPRWEGPDISPAKQHQLLQTIRKPGQYKLVLTDTIHGCPSLPVFIMVSDSAYTPAVRLIAEDSLNCANPEIYLNAAGSQEGKNLVYQWWDNTREVRLRSDTKRAQIVMPGDYALSVVDTLFGCTSTQTISVGIDTVAPKPSILPVDTLTCARNTVSLQAAPPPAGQVWAYSWVSASGDSTLFDEANIRQYVQNPGIYSLRVQHLRNGCKGIAYTDVLIDTLPPQANGGSDQELDCLSRQTTLQGIELDPRWKYQWRDASTGFILARSPELTLELPGIYTFEAIDPSNGCSAKDSVLVTMNQNMPFSIDLEVSPETCAGRSDGQLRVLEVEGGTPPFVYRLSSSTIFSRDRQFRGLKPGSYRITLQDAQGCELTERFDIFPGIAATLSLGNDLNIKLGDRVRISGLTNISAGALAMVQWTKPDTLKNAGSLQVNVVPISTTVYAATVRDTNGCTASDSLTIFVERAQRVFFPSAFSPNGDGTNDIFMVFGGQEVTKIKSLRLFNRWGILMYEQFDFPPNDPGFGWSGEHRGIMQNPAVYVYYAEVEFLDGSTAEFKGEFTLVR